MESLDDRQRKQLVNHNYFEVRGGGRRKFYQWLIDGFGLRRRRTYRIVRSSEAMVLDYCVHVRSNNPIWDDMLTLKFWIEGDEAGFRSEANYTGPYVPY